MGWCLNELVYFLAAGNVTLLFSILLILNLFLLRYDSIKKISSLAIVSLLIVGVGAVLSESYIDYLNTSDCTNRGDISTTSMVLSGLVIVFVCFAVRKRKHVFNGKVDMALNILFILFLSTMISIFVWEGDFLESMEFLIFAPFKNL